MIEDRGHNEFEMQKANCSEKMDVTEEHMSAYDKIDNIKIDAAKNRNEVAAQMYYFHFSTKFRQHFIDRAVMILGTQKK